MNAITNTTTTTATEERALALLGAGIAPETVAASLGVSPSRISQLLSDDEFAAKVSELRYTALAKHNERDTKIDSLEDAVLSRIEESLPMVQRPMELTKMFQVINSAKRRGSSAPESIIEKQQVISLVMPAQIIQNFQTNIQNQVVNAGGQSLLTMQSGVLADKIKARETQREENQNGISRLNSAEAEKTAAL